MARAHSPAHAPAPTAQPVEAAPPATWADWFGRFQALQVHALRDTLTVYNRYLAALAASRDPQAVTTANQAAASGWAACVDGIVRQWNDLARAVPADALAATGWRLKRGAHAAAPNPLGEAPDFLEQSRLGVEMLLRPWLPAPGLDHTDEFVA